MHHETNVLNYAPPPRQLPWGRWLLAAAAPCVPGLAAVALSGVLSSAAMRDFQSTTGRTVLTGPPDGHYFQLWVGVIPIVLVTTLLALMWLLTTYRSPRRDRPVIAVLSAFFLACLWLASAWWVARNGEIAFP